MITLNDIVSVKMIIIDKEEMICRDKTIMITAEEVAESMGISLGYAYKLLRKLNKELADQDM